MFGYPWQNVRDPLALPAGALRTPVELQVQAATQDSYGQPLSTWSAFYTTFAAISTVSSRELYQAMQFVSQVTHRVTLRWPGASIAIKAGQRVVAGSHVYLIQAVENVQERNRVLNLMCLEIDGSE